MIGRGRGERDKSFPLSHMKPACLCIIPAACVGMGGNCYGDNYLNKFPITFFY